MKKIISITALSLTIWLSAIIPSAIAKPQTPPQCSVNGALPDSGCTPGAIFENASKDIICKAGYTKTVRNVSTTTKKKVFAEYGMDYRTGLAYEVDHLIPLELGGSNEIINLWPEAADPNPGFHEKDQVENYLHKQVCAGAMSLKDAQQAIALDWQNVNIPEKPPVQTVPAPSTVMPTPSAPPIQHDPLVPAGATAKCRDESFSYSLNHSGACSRHGGVAQWL